MLEWALPIERKLPLPEWGAAIELIPAEHREECRVYLRDRWAVHRDWAQIMAQADSGGAVAPSQGKVDNRRPTKPSARGARSATGRKPKA